MYLCHLRQEYFDPIPQSCAAEADRPVTANRTKPFCCSLKGTASDAAGSRRRNFSP